MSFIKTKEELIYEKVLKKTLGIELGEYISPNDLNVEKLVEKAIAKVGELKWVGEDNKPWDYEDDKSDCKTSSIKPKNSIEGTITGTSNKEGALRCVVSNPFSPNGVDYFFIPIDDVRKLETDVGGEANKKRPPELRSKKISYSYNIQNDSYSKLNEFRCSSFEEMCKKK
tara:strand:- start:278 stop:787 length:510 start_codon:yes stop_codon:yes gene_type:complete